MFYWQGFEARGTVINKRWRTRSFLAAAAHGGQIASHPMAKINTSKLNRTLLFKQTAPTSKTRRDSTQAKKRNFRLAMCDSPNVFTDGKVYYKMVFASKTSSANLWSARSLKAACHMEDKVLRETPGFRNNCYRHNVTYGTIQIRECCPSWSVGNYIAALSGRSSCQYISSVDVQRVLSLLRRCAPFYINATLKENCWSFKHNILYPICRDVPKACARYNAVHNILFYLTDKNFFGPRGEKLLYTAVLTPARSDKLLRERAYDTHLKNGQVSNGAVKLVGVEFYLLKFDTFNKMLMADIIYPSIAMMIILIIMWLYTESVLLTLLLVLSVFSALIVAYFLYMIVFGLNFFPFLNITTMIFLVGIGADDAFVFTDVWRQSKKNNPRASLTQITTETLKHASLSMFVTSLTTAAAFLSNFSSQITTIKCFGLYAGMAILCKFSMMVTWFPAACVINETLCLPRSCSRNAWRRNAKLFYEKNVGAFVRYCFDDLLPRIVIKFRFLWIALFSLLAAGGLEVLLFKPGFQLATSSDFQMFESSHPLETYQLYLKDQFRSETSPSQGSATFPIDIVWGVKAADNGDALNPYDHGHFEWDENFDIITSESQEWLLRFCRRLRNQDFYAKKNGLVRYCFLEAFYNQSCEDPLTTNISYYPCCRETAFPFNKTVLDFCATSANVRATQLKYKRQESTFGSFIYDKGGNLKGVHLRVTSNVRLSRAYEPARHFWERIESWITKEMRHAPPGMRGGWWVSSLEFYDLQRSLSTGTLVSMAIAIGMAFAVMLLTTLNVLVSLYAILTIIGIISVTIGSLVLSGWKLNILESITMSVAVGVSIDFALHFGVAYCLAPDKENRQARVRFSLSRMGSAITMAAITTFIAGKISDRDYVYRRVWQPIAGEKGRDGGGEKGMRNGG